MGSILSRKEPSDKPGTIRPHFITILLIEQRKAESCSRRELLLEHHDERLTDGGLDLAIGASSGAQKTQGNYCTICCTIPDTGG